MIWLRNDRIDVVCATVGAREDTWLTILIERDSGVLNHLLLP